MVSLVIIWIICAFISAIIAANKDSSIIGFSIIGFLLGPLGIIIALVGSGKECYYCGKRISKNAKICPYCRKETSRKETKSDYSVERILKEYGSESKNKDWILDR